MFIYTQPCVKEGFKTALGDAYSSEDKVELKMRNKKEGKEKNQCHDNESDMESCKDILSSSECRCKYN